MKLAITIMLTASCGLLQAQKVSVGIEGYVGTFDMSSLRQYQSVSKDYYIPFKTIQDFPLQPGIRILASMNVVDAYNTGVLFGFISTGSRLAYSDLTGDAYRDVTASGFQFGSYNRYTFFNYKKLSLHARMNLGGVLSTVDIDRHIRLKQPQYESKEISQWRSVNFYSEIGVEAGVTMGRFLFKMFSSYEFGVPGKMTRKDNNRTFQGEQTFGVDWSGVRAGVGIDYKLSKQN